jgi:hypothetical protein
MHTMRRNGKNWRENITYEWCDNPPRRNTKANNRWLRELRKQLVALPLSRLAELLDDGYEWANELACDAVWFQVKIPRSLVAIVRETAEMKNEERARVIGVSYCYDRPAWRLDPVYLQRKRDNREAWKRRNDG